MNTWPYVPRVVESVMSCEYTCESRSKVGGRRHEVLLAVVVNDRKNYVMLEQSATSRNRSRTAENEPGQMWPADKGGYHTVRWSPRNRI